MRNYNSIKNPLISCQKELKRPLSKQIIIELVTSISQTRLRPFVVLSKLNQGFLPDFYLTKTSAFLHKIICKFFSNVIKSCSRTLFGRMEVKIHGNCCWSSSFKFQLEIRVCRIFSYFFGSMIFFVMDNLDNLSLRI